MGCILCVTLQKSLAFEAQQKPPKNERQALRPAEELQPWAQLGEQQWQCEPWHSGHHGCCAEQCTPRPPAQTGFHLGTALPHGLTQESGCVQQLGFASHCHHGPDSGWMERNPLVTQICSVGCGWSCGDVSNWH